jgi:DNA/RNA endonuclease G (NUC1)
VREIEKNTGYDFFSALPPDVQEAIENREDSN